MLNDSQFFLKNQLEKKLCLGLNAINMDDLYDKHHKVSSLKNTQFCQYGVITVRYQVQLNPY